MRFAWRKLPIRACSPVRRGPEGGNLLLRHPQAGVRVRRGDEQSAQGGIYRRRRYWKAELKKQVIGYGERTMNEIVEAYVNPDLPPEEWDLSVDEQGEGIRLSPWDQAEQLRAFARRTEAFLREQLRNAYDLETDRAAAPDPDAGGGTLLHPSRVDTLWREHLRVMDALRESVGCVATARRIP